MHDSDHPKAFQHLCKTWCTTWFGPAYTCSYSTLSQTCIRHDIYTDTHAQFMKYTFTFICDPNGLDRVQTKDASALVQELLCKLNHDGGLDCGSTSNIHVYCVLTLTWVLRLFHQWSWPQYCQKQSLRILWRDLQLLYIGVEKQCRVKSQYSCEQTT